jgi:putative hydrolase of the HAD superfamily
MIDTITFDLWNTLIYFSPEDNLKFKNKRIEGFIEVLKNIGVNLSREEMEKAYDESSERYKPIREREEDISTREQVQIILGCLETHCFKEFDEEVLNRLEEVLANQILTELPTLEKGSEEILSYLKNKNFKIGLICNTGRTPGKVLREVLKRKNIFQFFKALTFSDELRIRKPNPKIFISTLESLNSFPNSSLHIGDLLESDIFGAKRCGMKAGWICPDRDGCQIYFLPEQRPDFILPNLTSLKIILDKESIVPQ